MMTRMNAAPVVFAARWFGLDPCVRVVVVVTSRYVILIFLFFTHGVGENYLSISCSADSTDDINVWGSSQPRK